MTATARRTAMLKRVRQRAAAAPVDTLDHALILELRLRDAPCCRCAAADHDDRGCWPRCRRAYADHPAREESEAVEAWREAGSSLAMWTRDWCREDPPQDQGRPTPITGELGALTSGPERGVGPTA